MPRIARLPRRSARPRISRSRSRGRSSPATSTRSCDVASRGEAGRRPDPPPSSSCDGLLLADLQIAREGIALDDAFALSVDRLEPAAHPAVLLLRRALDVEVEVVAEASAVR